MLTDDKKKLTLRLSPVEYELFEKVQIEIGEAVQSKAMVFLIKKYPKMKQQLFNKNKTIKELEEELFEAQEALLKFKKFFAMVQNIEIDEDYLNRRKIGKKVKKQFIDGNNG